MKLATFRTRGTPAGQFGALIEDGRLLDLRAGGLSLLSEYSLPDRVEASRLLRHAQEYVAGYTIFNDLSARDVQRAESERGNHVFGKNFDTSGPLGPYLVTADEVPNPQRLTIELRVNGELRQHGTTAQMIHDVPAL